MNGIRMTGVAVLFLSVSSCLVLQGRAQQDKSEVLSSQIRQASLLGQQAKFAEAEEAWKGVIKSDPRNAMAYAQLGLTEAREEKYAEAVASYRKAKGLNPAIPQLNLNLGLALFKSHCYPEAASLFDAEQKKAPGNQRLAILAGMSHYGARQYGEASVYLKEAVAIDPRNLELLLTLGHCYLWTKQFDAALGVYKQILLINPDSAEADMIAGEALDEKGDAGGAVQQFRAAVRANPKEPNVHFGLAYLLWTLKHYEEAVPEFLTELQNDPRNYQAMIYLGDTYVRIAAYDKAGEILRKAAASQSSVSLIHLDLGIVYQETGDNDHAVRELKETVRMEPDNVNAHFRLAQIYRATGKKDQAKVEFTKARSLNQKTDAGVFKRIEEAGDRPGPAGTGTAADPQAAPAKPATPEQP